MLAIIAGRGALPAVLAKAAKGPVLIAALEGFTPDGCVPDVTFRLEGLGSLPDHLKDQGVSSVVFAGGIERPQIDPSQIDAKTLPLVPRLMAALQAGDDAALRTVIEIFEEAGLTVSSAHEIAPDLLPDAGVLTVASPDVQAEEDAVRAGAVAKVLGQADVGQGCVVHKGQVLAMEGVYGTDWMLSSLAQRPDGAGGVFFKAPKPGQDRRVDLPVIGPGTIDSVLAAGLSGVVIAAGGVMILDRAATIAAANAAGLFIWVRPE